METDRSMAMPSPLTPAAVRPITSYGCRINSLGVCAIVLGLANLPNGFQCRDLTKIIPPQSYWPAQGRIADRLLQRWRKMGRLTFRNGGWHMSTAAWGAMQDDVRLAKAMEAGTAETTGSVHESAVGNAETPNDDTLQEEQS